jgi:hypothetical protein
MMEYMEAAMQGYMEAMEKQREEVWDEANKRAKDQLGEAYISGMPPEFPSMNPHQKGEWQHEEWEAAHDHFIMSGLGY